MNDNLMFYALRRKADKKWREVGGWTDIETDAKIYWSVITATMDSQKLNCDLINITDKIRAAELKTGKYHASRFLALIKDPTQKSVGICMIRGGYATQ